MNLLTMIPQSIALTITPRGYPLMLGIDAIKALGGMVVGLTGLVQLGNKEIVN